jgi:predicted dehydrogenase
VTPLAIGLIGCGRLAELGYVPALLAARGVRLIAVADPDPTRRAAVAAGRPSFPDAASLVAAGAVDALVLASPSDAHVADAAIAVANGLPVLVEKPPAPDAVGAAALAELGPLVRVGFNRRFDDGAQRVRAALPAGGPIEVHVAIGYRRQAWSAHTVVDDALADLGPHLVDWARWIGGDVTEITSAHVRPTRADVNLRVARGRVRLSAAMDQVHHELVELRAPGGDVIASHRVGGLVAGVTGRLRRNAPHPLVASLTAELEAFARAVGGADEPLLGTGADGLAVMTAIDAARACAASGGRPVPVPPLSVR